MPDAEGLLSKCSMADSGVFIQKCMPVLPPFLSVALAPESSGAWQASEHTSNRFWFQWENGTFKSEILFPWDRSCFFTL